MAKEPYIRALNYILGELTPPYRIFHPIVGDTKHGRGEHNKLFREKYDCNRLLLHAKRVEFIHPVDKKKIIIEAGVDEIFQKLFKTFEWEFEV